MRSWEMLVSIGGPSFWGAALPGGGRTCLTCHSRETGTLSPQDVQALFAADPEDALFRHDGRDDGQGHGVSSETPSRMTSYPAVTRLPLQRRRVPSQRDGFGRGFG